MPSKASKLLERMRRSKTNWKRKDLDSLYEGFGFIIESSSNHDKVWHPEYPQLVTFLPRHREVARYLVSQAVQMIDKLARLEERGKADE